MRPSYAIFVIVLGISAVIAVLPDPNTRNACGVWTGDRIFGGVATQIDEYPWMALLAYTWQEEQVSVFGCGGSLIDERHVITAAHCISEEDPILTHVRLGEWNTSSPHDCFAEDDCADDPVDIPISMIFKHPEYNKNGGEENDIAILRLRTPVTYSYFIKPICLPSEPELRTKTNYDGTKFVTAGWGRTEKKQQSDVKMKTVIDFMSLTACNKVYNTIGRQISTKQLCAGGKDIKDSCQGDSGGPLMTTFTKNKNNYAYLAGLVSYGPAECGSRGWPGIYTRVGAYISWIESCVNKPDPVRRPSPNRRG